jgi:hypothetical protein
MIKTTFPIPKKSVFRRLLRPYRSPVRSKLSGPGYQPSPKLKHRGFVCPNRITKNPKLAGFRPSP